MLIRIFALTWVFVISSGWATSATFAFATFFGIDSEARVLSITIPLIRAASSIASPFCFLIMMSLRSTIRPPFFDSAIVMTASTTIPFSFTLTCSIDLPVMEVSAILMRVSRSFGSTRIEFASTISSALSMPMV